MSDTRDRDHVTVTPEQPTMLHTTQSLSFCPAHNSQLLSVAALGYRMCLEREPPVTQNNSLTHRTDIARVAGTITATVIMTFTVIITAAVIIMVTVIIMLTVIITLTVIMMVTVFITGHRHHEGYSHRDSYSHNNGYTVITMGTVC